MSITSEKKSSNEKSESDLKSCTDVEEMANLSKTLVSSLTIANRGTGAGGSNTNKTGLSYEVLTDLSTNYIVSDKGDYWKYIRFRDQQPRDFVTFPKKSGLMKYMKQVSPDLDINGMHGTKQPDECYLDEDECKLIIIEKKFQQTTGSVVEKLQTCDAKKWQYSRLFPDYKVFYVYCLSEWFKDNAKAELEYLDYKKVPYFWGNEENYKTKMINFISSI